VKAVYQPELQHYYNVIVVSVMDRDRSLLSILGGGDYDGGNKIPLSLRELRESQQP
jgi:hypothetical protein